MQKWLLGIVGGIIAAVIAGTILLLMNSGDGNGQTIVNIHNESGTVNQLWNAPVKDVNAILNLVLVQGKNRIPVPFEIVDDSNVTVTIPVDIDPANFSLEVETVDGETLATTPQLEGGIGGGGGGSGISTLVPTTAPIQPQVPTPTFTPMPPPTPTASPTPTPIAPTTPPLTQTLPPTISASVASGSCGTGSAASILASGTSIECELTFSGEVHWYNFEAKVGDAVFIVLEVISKSCPSRSG